jgi:long-chain acyl-CoA synthetase
MSEHLSQVWAETVRQAPGAFAVGECGNGRRWSRAELAAAAESWRAALPPGAALAGRRVAMAEPNGAGWWHVFLGLLAAGAIPMPLDSAEPPAGRRATAQAAGAAWLWHEGRLEPIAARRPARRHDGCLVKLTSGSTGGPRALVFTHAQMLADGRQVCATMGITPDDVNLAVIPLGHSYGLGNLVVPLLTQGTAMVCAASPLPHVLAADCARWRPTVFPAVPTLLRALVRSEIEAAAWASLRLAISAGAPLPAAEAVAFREKFGQPVHGFYGASETGGVCYDRTGEATATGRSVGPPLTGVRLHFRRGRRFVVESAAVMGRGAYSPRDLAELRADGELTLLGRAGRAVKIAGRRLDLAEIEAALRAVPGVRDAYAAAHPTRADALAAAVATELTVGALRAELGRRVAAWKIPEHWMVLGEFPATARGKTDTRRLKALLTST